jgi:predicted DNA-binding transcriptional regulator AlpA
MALFEHEILSLNELSKVLRVDRRTLYRWRDEQEDFPPAYHLGEQSVVYMREDVLKWLDGKKRVKSVKN